MADLQASSFRVHSTLGLPVDAWEADMAGPAAFVEASEADKITLAAGFHDAGGHEHVIGHLVDGRVDEYVLQIDRDAVRTTLRGRDPLAALLERHVVRRYLRLPLRDVVERTADDGIPFVTPEAEGSGRFRASQIAQETTSTPARCSSN
jgi:hypothetical protein